MFLGQSEHCIKWSYTKMLIQMYNADLRLILKIAFIKQKQVTKASVRTRD